MKRSLLPMNLAAAIAALLPVCANVCYALSLEEGFRNPPNSAKPHTWYHMMNGNVTKEGITCDFEALASAGIGGVQMFDAGCNIPPGPLAFNSPEWFDMFQHAAAEARRLGLEICIPNCSGWSSSGGPWNMPSNGMKKVVFTETPVHGPSSFRDKLPRTKSDHGFYEDIAVLAFPAPPADAVSFPDVTAAIGDKTVTLSSPTPFTAAGMSFRLSYPRVWTESAKASVEISRDGTTFEPFETFTSPLAFSGTCDYSLRYHPFPSPVTARAIRLTLATSVAVKIEEAMPEAKLRLTDIAAKTFDIRGSVTRDASEAAPSQIVRRDRIVDLTARMAPDGSLAWDVPAGDWILLRVGYICNGRRNHPASKHGAGLEVDKLSASAMDYHFDQYVTRLCDRLGPLAGAVASGFNNILVDSYEVGSQNWTQGLEKMFEARMGYSPLPYLPVFTGRVVGSVDESERFLEDFRRVVADLFAENYAGRLAKLCHQHGLMLSVEPYGNAPCDDLQYGQDVDIPMGEFWSNAKQGDHAMGSGNAYFAASLAHVWGRRYAATESFSAGPSNGGRWLTTPFTIKAQGDGVYCDGVNRIIYHRFVHQPWPGNKYLPGMTMGHWGMHFDRTQTWWPFVGPWLRYQARCQWMLQEGTFAADVLFFCGEQSPNKGSRLGDTDRPVEDVKLPPGYKWDICATKVLEELKVMDGCVVVPGGVAYRLLVLPPQETMSERLLRKVDALVDAGAKVCGMVKPGRAPGLRGYPAADGRVRALADKVWAKGVFTCRPAEALARLGVEPDFASGQNNPAPNWIHRRDKDADWYFVALNNVNTHTFEISFRQTGRTPELWDAETGKSRPAEVWREEGGRTYVTLTFPPSGSAFVVFRKPATGDHVVDVTVKPAKSPDASPVWEWSNGRILAWQPLTAEARTASGRVIRVAADPPAPVPVDGAWTVSFPEGWDAPASATFPTLVSWTERPEDGIKYFSGTATYAKRVATPKLPPHARLMLDLGNVKNFAEVTVNGKVFPVLWKPPFRVDVTDALAGGKATLDLSIRVTNLWPNRLIGDDRLYADDCEWKGEKKNGVNLIGIKEIPQWVKDGRRSPTGRHTFTTWKHWDKDHQLLPSGLLGPVVLRTLVPTSTP